MRVTVFGANGDSGKEIVKHLLDNGHTVVAAVRRPKEIKVQTNLEVSGPINFNDIETIKSAIKGSDVVVSAIGTGGLGAAHKYTTLYSNATRAIRTAMKHCNVKRIIVLSSLGADYEKELPWFYRTIIRPYIMNTYMDMARMEAILEESKDMEWTSVRLPQLMKGKHKSYKTKEGHMNGGGASYKINYVDVGEFVANEITKNDFVCKHAAISY